MSFLDDVKRGLGMKRPPSAEAKRVIRRIDVLMQRFEPWRLSAKEGVELNQLLARQAENRWYFEPHEIYPAGSVPKHLVRARRVGSGGGARAKHAAFVPSLIHLIHHLPDGGYKPECGATSGKRMSVNVDAVDCPECIAAYRKERERIRALDEARGAIRARRKASSGGGTNRGAGSRR